MDNSEEVRGFCMAETKKVKRTATKHKSIYFNESTRMYDVKYNFTVYDVTTKKNKYCQKWVYGIGTISEAKKVLADLVQNGVKEKDKEITLEGAFEFWKKYAERKPLSLITIRNTTQHYNVIIKYIPKDTKIKNLNEDIYLDMMAACRKDKYSEESLHSINATFRKFINLLYKKKMISNNFLLQADNYETKTKQDYRLITPEEYEQLDDYFAKGGFIRNGVDNFKEYRLLIAILYFCGLRIGECLALTYDDIEAFDYRKKQEQKGIWVHVSDKDLEQKNLQGKRLIVNKAYVTKTKQIKETKNKKVRTIPINERIDYLLGHINKSYEYQTNPQARKQRMFPWSDGAVNDTLERACKKLGIEPKITCHSFRHTYISNLIRLGVPLPTIEKVSGDNQETILKRYSHMFEQDERLVLAALQNL